MTRYPVAWRMTLNNCLHRASRRVSFHRTRFLPIVFTLTVMLWSCPPGLFGHSQWPTDEKNQPSLAREIHQQLLTLPFYSVFDVITFSLDGRKVTLSGEVLRPTLKVHAEAAIKSIEGIDTVINQIEVLPNSTSDNELRRGIYRAIFEDPTLAVYAVQTVPAIHIIVKNGNVTLEGAVRLQSDKNLAGLWASKLANVASVKNNLIVRSNRNAGE
jgi:hyperosmotically inducible periplasmic protein